MTGLLELVSPARLLARGAALAAGALRAGAGALHVLADALDGASTPADASAPPVADAPLPGAGTRERIGEALQRARTRYDEVGARSPRAARPRPR